jgi:hypothetical protein
MRRVTRLAVGRDNLGVLSTTKTERDPYPHLEPTIPPFRGLPGTLYLYSIINRDRVVR